MNKQEFLKDYKKQEDKLCLSQVLDKIEFCESREKLEYTDFLDMYQVALVENFLRRINFKNYQFFGGYEDSERKILIVYPDKFIQYGTVEELEKIYHQDAESIYKDIMTIVDKKRQENETM